MRQGSDKTDIGADEDSAAPAAKRRQRPCVSSAAAPAAAAMHTAAPHVQGAPQPHEATGRSTGLHAQTRVAQHEAMPPPPPRPPRSLSRDRCQEIAVTAVPGAADHSPSGVQSAALPTAQHARLPATDLVDIDEPAEQPQPLPPSLVATSSTPDLTPLTADAQPMCSVPAQTVQQPAPAAATESGTALIQQSAIETYGDPDAVEIEIGEPSATLLSEADEAAAALCASIALRKQARIALAAGAGCSRAVPQHAVAIAARLQGAELPPPQRAGSAPIDPARAALRSVMAACWRHHAKQLGDTRAVSRADVAALAALLMTLGWGAAPVKVVSAPTKCATAMFQIATVLPAGWHHRTKLVAHPAWGCSSSWLQVWDLHFAQSVKCSYMRCVAHGVRYLRRKSRKRAWSRWSMMSTQTLRQRWAVPRQRAAVSGPERQRR